MVGAAPGEKGGDDTAEECAQGEAGAGNLLAQVGPRHGRGEGVRRHRLVRQPAVAHDAEPPASVARQPGRAEHQGAGPLQRGRRRLCGARASRPAQVREPSKGVSKREQESLKDRTKLKRQKDQSASFLGGRWKTEQEMHMRDFFDS